MTIDQGLERAWIQTLYWVRQSFGPVNKKRFSKKASVPLTAAEDAERKVASVLVPQSIWGALRHGGIEPSKIRADERDAFLEACAVEWANRVVDELPMLKMDRGRLEARVRLKWISKTSVFTGRDALRAAIAEFERTGEVRRLEHGACDARRAVGAAGTWQATVDVAALTLGNEDPDVVVLRTKLEKDLDDLAQTLTEARPLLEQHGVPVADLFPDD